MSSKANVRQKLSNFFSIVSTILFLVASVMSFQLLLNVVVSIKSYDKAREISRLENELRLKTEENERLRIKVMTAISVDKLVEYSSLNGWVKPKEVIYINIK